MGSKLLLLLPILPKIVNGKKCQKNKVLTDKKASSGANPMLLNYGVAVMKYRLSPAAVLFLKTENNN